MTVACAKRNFSKLKLVKIYLRSTLGNEKLSDLSIEADIADTKDYSRIIDEFAKQNV